jgi:hypothetical protein
MQQKIDELTKEKEEFLKQKENLEKGYLLFCSMYVHLQSSLLR